MPLNWPNTLTWLRICAIPLVALLFYMPYPWADPAAGLLFALAGITDSLDGYLARRLGQTSRPGAFLDPVADKLIVAGGVGPPGGPGPRGLCSPPPPPPPPPGKTTSHPPAWGGPGGAGPRG